MLIVCLPPETAHTILLIAVLYIITTVSALVPGEVWLAPVLQMFADEIKGKETIMLKQYTILICFLIISAPVYGQTANIDLQTLTSICESYENSIADVNVEYNFEVTDLGKGDAQANFAKFVGSQKGSLIAAKPFDQLYRLSLTMLMDDGKTRLQTYVIGASNGSVYKEYQRTGETNGTNRTSGVITNDRTSMSEYNVTPLGFTIFHRVDNVNNVKSLLDILKGRCDYYAVSLDPNISKVNDFNAVEVACVSSRFKTLIFKGLSLFFSVDHNYTLVKIVWYNGPGRVRSSYDIAQLKNIGNGIWFPGKAYIKNNSGVIENTYTTDKAAINQAPASEIFDIEFPPGTEVFDKITGKQYVIKPTQEQVDQSLPQ